MKPCGWKLKTPVFQRKTNSMDVAQDKPDTLNNLICYAILPRHNPTTPEPSMVSALAVVCVRNEAVHIRRCLNDLISSGLEVHVIDNHSTDGTREIAESYLGNGVIAIDDLPWGGSFSLSDQLSAKRQIIAKSGHDWILHCDADEWLVNPTANKSLIEGMTAADKAGFNCINFHELVFIPLPGEDFETIDYAQHMGTYYFFQPSYPRLNRAWRRDIGLDNSASGGHLLSGERVKLYPTNFILRHYIALSEKHARRKYIGRNFSNADVCKGWHGNRLNIDEGNLSFKLSPYLRHLPTPSTQEFDLSCPVTQHFWEW